MGAVLLLKSRSCRTVAGGAVNRLLKDPSTLEVVVMLRMKHDAGTLQDAIDEKKRINREKSTERAPARANASQG